ncbi:hypothetical protein WG909_08475 [Peptostreptococcaceae bacterium AGR-M142]
MNLRNNIAKFLVVGAIFISAVSPSFAIEESKTVRLNEHDDENTDFIEKKVGITKGKDVKVACDDLVFDYNKDTKTIYELKDIKLLSNVNMTIDKNKLSYEVKTNNKVEEIKLTIEAWNQNLDKKEESYTRNFENSLADTISFKDDIVSYSRLKINIKDNGQTYEKIINLKNDNLYKDTKIEFIFVDIDGDERLVAITSDIKENIFVYDIKSDINMYEISTDIDIFENDLDSYNYKKKNKISKELKGNINFLKTIDKVNMKINLNDSKKIINKAITINN